jgi:ABC-type uncharacterized transport system auxiliary subunit
MHRYKSSTGCVCASIACILLFLALTGCGAPPMKSYYTLENNTLGKAASRAAVLCKLPLAVDPVVVAPPYDLTKVVFRPDDLEVRFYANRYWVTAPEEMMTKLVVRRIESERIFPSVDATVHVSGPHLTLIAKLHNLEEMDRNGTWNGRIAMHFILKDEMEEHMLWEHHFDVVRPVPKTDIKSVVSVLNKIYNDEMDVLVKSLEAFFKSHGGCGVQLSPRDEDEEEPYE